MAITIKVVEHGPYLINNDDAAQVTVVDAAGNTLTSPKVGKGIALCRCGASLNKPFCDGAHKALPTGTLQLGLLDK
jgi:CDGSH-type Zn-finger protein